MTTERDAQALIESATLYFTVGGRVVGRSTWASRSAGCERNLDAVLYDLSLR